jgi:O-methyltransferase
MIKLLIQKLLNFFGYKISKINSKLIFPIEIKNKEKKIIEECFSYTMTGISRMYALTKCLENVVKNNIEGSFVECGVWRGGNLILAQKIFDNLLSERTIYGFDTFSGMSEPTEYDIDHKGFDAKKLLNKSSKVDNKKNIWAYVSEDNVTKNINSNLLRNRIKLIKGDVKETLLDNRNLPSKISVLRLDTDWYESTKAELEILYPLLEKNGFLIIDDYGHFEGARKAVNEYFKKIKIQPYMHVVDYSCRIIIKQ